MPSFPMLSFHDTPLLSSQAKHARAIKDSKGKATKSAPPQKNFPKAGSAAWHRMQREGEDGEVVEKTESDEEREAVQRRFAKRGLDGQQGPRDLMDNRDGDDDEEGGGAEAGAAVDLNAILANTSSSSSHAFTLRDSD